VLRCCKVEDEVDGAMGIYVTVATSGGEDGREDRGEERERYRSGRWRLPADVCRLFGLE
jgi:hypothetical protein